MGEEVMKHGRLGDNQGKLCPLDDAEIEDIKKCIEVKEISTTFGE